MLSAIAIVAIDAGAFAFKSKHAFGVKYYTTTVSGNCPNTTFGDAVTATTVPLVYTTTTPGAQCLLQARIQLEPKPSSK